MGYLQCDAGGYRVVAGARARCWVGLRGLFVTARTKGTMRLFVGTTLIATKANGSKAACAAPVDSSFTLAFQPAHNSASRREDGRSA